MPQRPYPSVVEKARESSKLTAKLAKASVVRTQRRKRFRHNYAGSTVIRVVDGGNAWSAYLRRMLEASGLSVAELARRAQIDRSTISVWLNHGFGPKKITIESVRRIAEALDADLQPALDAAAGIVRPERDPEIAMILASDLPDDRKAELIERLEERREAERRRRVEDIRFLLGESDERGEATG